jgi:UDP-N-acetylmuramoyl-tripeptide--D-alanyl-D-alanine ligase
MGWQYTLNELASIVGGTLEMGGETRFSGISKDTRTLQPGEVYFALRGEQFDGEAFVGDAIAAGAAGVVCRVRRPGAACLVVSNPLTALQRFAAHHRSRFNVPLIAITGSCGKTTSKDYTAAVLETRYRVVKTKGNLNNDIGVPLSLLQMDESTERVVLEMGANHAGEISDLCLLAKPSESAITMIGPAHLEGFGRVDDVAAAKSEIMYGLPETGTFYANQDDARCRELGEKFKGKIVRYGSSGDVALRSCAFNEAGLMELEVHPVGKLTVPLRSRPLASNVLLAVAIGLEHGIEDFQSPLEAACRNSVRFRQLTVGPLDIIDDSYNANPASMAAALRALGEYPGSGRRWALLGDMLELGEESERLHRETGAEAAAAGVDVLLARGSFAESIVDGARDAGVARAEAIETHEAIARAVFDAAEPGDLVLVKGSRGMTMEKIIDNLKIMYDDPSGELTS